MGKILAVSIRQPWAELILTGKKTMELRSWGSDYRGLLWVHTGFKSDPELERSFGFYNLFKGGYVGIVTLSGIIPLNLDDWEHYRPNHLDLGGYSPNYFGWFLDSPRRFVQPVEGPGQLGLYEPSVECVRLLEVARHQLDTDSSGIDPSVANSGH